MARISVADLYELIEAGDETHHRRRALERRRGRSSRAGYPARFTCPWTMWAGTSRIFPETARSSSYCTCPSEASAARVAKLLINHGFKEVRPLYGGLDAWIEAGYAVDGAPQEARSA